MMNFAYELAAAFADGGFYATAIGQQHMCIVNTSLSRRGNTLDGP